MFIPKGAALIRGRRLFEVRRLSEEIRYCTTAQRAPKNSEIKGKMRRQFFETTSIL